MLETSRLLIKARVAEPCLSLPSSRTLDEGKDPVHLGHISSKLRGGMPQAFGSWGDWQHCGQKTTAEGQFDF